MTAHQEGAVAGNRVLWSLIGQRKGREGEARGGRAEKREKKKGWSYADRRSCNWPFECMDLKMNTSATLQGMYLKSISISGTAYDKLSKYIQSTTPLDLVTGYLGSTSENSDVFQRHYQGSLWCRHQHWYSWHGECSIVVVLDRLTEGHYSSFHRQPKDTAQSRTLPSDPERGTLKLGDLIELIWTGKTGRDIQIRDKNQKFVKNQATKEPARN